MRDKASLKSSAIKNYAELLEFLQKVENWSKNNWNQNGISTSDNAKKFALNYERKSFSHSKAGNTEAIVGGSMATVYNALADAIQNNSWKNYQETIKKLINQLHEEQSKQFSPITLQTETAVNLMDDLREIISFIQENKRNPKQKKLIDKALHELEGIDFTVKDADGMRFYQLLPEDYIALHHIIGIEENLKKARLADDLTKPYSGKKTADTESLVLAIKLGAKVRKGVKVIATQVQAIVAPGVRLGITPFEKQQHFATHADLTDLQLSNETIKHLKNLGRTDLQSPILQSVSDSSVDSSPTRFSSPITTPKKEKKPIASPTHRDSISRLTKVLSLSDSNPVTNTDQQKFLELSYDNLQQCNNETKITLKNQDSEVLIKSISVCLSLIQQQYNQIRNERYFKGAHFLERALEYAQDKLGVSKNIKKDGMNDAQKLWVVLKYAEAKPKKRTALALAKVIHEQPVTLGRSPKRR